MMTWKIRIAIILILVVALIAMVNLIRRRKLELKYALTWLFLGVGLLGVVLVPGVLDWFSNVLGIYSPVNMVFFFGFLFSIIVIFTLTIAISNNSNRVRKMAQKMALSEHKANRNSK